MALSRFWTFILILSIGYVLVMLAAGRQYTLGGLVNGKQGDPFVVAEMDTTALQGTPLLANIRNAGEAGYQQDDKLYTINSTGVVRVSVGKQSADGAGGTLRCKSGTTP